MANGRRYPERLNIYLEAEQRSALRTLAERSGVSESDLVRRAISYLLHNESFFVAPVLRETRVIASRAVEVA